MKKAICLLVIGEKYEKLYNETKEQFQVYANKCNAEIVLLKNKLDVTNYRSILAQKLLIPNELLNFDEVLFLDLDIIINENAPNVFDTFPKDKAFGAVLDPRFTMEFKNAWKRKSRIINETNRSYFESRNFEFEDKFEGSINGGVFIFRPKIVAPIFKEYYFSNHKQGKLNTNEEAPMAYLTQKNDLFYAMNPMFNVQVLYKIHQNEETIKIFKKAKRKNNFFYKYFINKNNWSIYPTEQYKNFIENELKQVFIMHFAGKFPII